MVVEGYFCKNISASLPEIPNRASLDKILSVWGRPSPLGCFFPTLYLKRHKNKMGPQNVWQSTWLSLSLANIDGCFAHRRPRLRSCSSWTILTETGYGGSRDQNEASSRSPFSSP